MVSRGFLLAALVLAAASASAASTWCLGMGGLGPIRAGMKVEEVLRLADWPGMETKKQPQECWYLNYEGGGANFRLMIIRNTVVRIELRGDSKLHTFSGAHIGTSEDELKALYGARLDIQPHKYDEHGHAITVKAGSGEYGLRFETSDGKVTAIQSGPWEHLNYVEGCG
ncbi:MAG: hypothetical protein ABI821_07810 [Pseudomonadota bacterium]